MDVHVQFYSYILYHYLGNYGNKLDHSLPSQMSTTSPATPIFDENAYYYLPWLQYKPCVVVESDWEDVSYRIDCQNIFLSIADELVSINTKVVIEVGNVKLIKLHSVSNKSILHLKHQYQHSYILCYKFIC